MENKKNIYIEIDTILDTRLTLLINLDKELAIDWVNNGNYHHRKEDTYSYLSNDVFKRMYAKRDKSVIKVPFPTKMLSFILEYCLKASNEDVDSGGNGIITVFLNTYPYDLSEVEEENIVNAIHTKLPDKIDVEIIHEELVSPKWINSNIRMLVKYDGIDWLERNVSNGKIIKNNLPNVILVIPTVMSKFREDEMKEEDIFDSYAKMASPYIQLEFIDVSIFSSI